jgi:rod shape-determining protein MreC
VGQVAQGVDGRLRVRLAADYERLEFLRVLRSHEAERITEPGGLIVPPMAQDGFIGPLPAATSTGAGNG